jgi:hypothetical protein
MDNMPENTDQIEKSFPYLHQLILKNGEKVVISDFYRIPEKEKNSYRAVPVVLLYKQKDFEKTVKRMAQKHMTNDLTQAIPELEKLKEQSAGGFQITQNEMKISLLEELHGKEFAKTQNNVSTAETFIEAIPYAGKLLTAIAKTIKKRFRNKELEETIERFHQQQKTLYLYLLQQEPAMVLFWKNHNPTFHILLKEEDYTSQALAELFYSQGRGVGKYSDFLAESLKEQSA